MSEENPTLPDIADLPEVDQTDTELPESIATVESEKEAITSFDDLWMNLRYQHREKFKKYADMQSSLSSMSFDRQETRIDFTELNELRDEIVKLEGGMETMNIQRRLLRNEDPEPWVELGARIGEAFQVADDLKDVTSTEKTVGKPTGQDSKNARPSAVLEFGVDGAIDRLQNILSGAIASIPACSGEARLCEIIRKQAKQLMPSFAANKVL